MPGNIAKDLTQERILVVEDEKDHLSFLTELFTLSGYLVTPALNGIEAVEKLSENDYSVVLTDIMMPEMDGLELLERIKEIKDDLPVIVITGQGNVDIAVDAMKKGAYDFLKKPLNINSVNDKIVKAIEQKKIIQMRKNQQKELFEQQRTLITSNNELRLDLMNQTGRLNQIKEALYGKITFLEAIIKQTPQTREFVNDYSWVYFLKTEQEELDISKRFKEISLTDDERIIQYEKITPYALTDELKSEN